MTKEQEAIKYFKNYTIYTKQLSEDEKRVNGQSIYQKDMEKRAKYFETVLNMLKENSAELAEKSAEIEKKDKQIDLMANYIVDLIKYNNPEEKREVEEIKQYFERKAKDGRN